MSPSTWSTKQRLTPLWGGGTGRTTYERRVRSGAAAGTWVMFPGFPVTTPSLPSGQGDEITSSEGHSTQNLSALRDEGGPFYNRKRYGKAKPYRLTHLEEVSSSGSTYDRQRWKDDRNLLCPWETMGNGKPVFPSSLESSDNTLTSFGTKAIAYCEPPTGGAELTTALGEVLKDGLPSLLGINTLESRALKARNAGDEYLNVEFGWLPLVSDLQSIASSVADSGRIIDQYVRDMGRPIRRSYSFPEIKQENTTLIGTRDPHKAPNASSSVFTASTPGALYRKERSVINRWFSGSFTYGPPLPYNSVQSSLTTADKAALVLGADLTPESLWNLLPWSWAVDWVANIGDLLTNVSNSLTYGSVMRYGYIMEHTVHEYEYTLVGATHMGVQLPNLTTTLVTETKKRVKANPFGFGITWNGLSAAQYAILAALGISRT